MTQDPKAVRCPTCNGPCKITNVLKEYGGPNNKHIEYIKTRHTTAPEREAALDLLRAAMALYQHGLSPRCWCVELIVKPCLGCKFKDAIIQCKRCKELEKERKE